LCSLRKRIHEGPWVISRVRDPEVGGASRSPEERDSALGRCEARAL
jgi:hypothetical protein